jgi:hypothetical protein
MFIYVCLLLQSLSNFFAFHLLWPLVVFHSHGHHLRWSCNRILQCPSWSVIYLSVYHSVQCNLRYWERCCMASFMMMVPCLDYVAPNVRVTSWVRTWEKAFMAKLEVRTASYHTKHYRRPPGLNSGLVHFVHVHVPYWVPALCLFSFFPAVFSRWFNCPLCQFPNFWCSCA